MRFRVPLSFVCVLYFLVGYSVGFTLEGIPTQVTLGQKFTATWSLQSQDPTSFLILASRANPTVESDFTNLGATNAASQTTGTMELRFFNYEGATVTLLGWDAGLEGDWPPIYKHSPPMVIAAATSQMSRAGTTESRTTSKTDTVRSSEPSTIPQSSAVDSPSIPTTSSSGSDTGKTPIIAGSVVGSVAAILLVLVSLRWWRRKQCRRQAERTHPCKDNMETVSPYPLAISDLDTVLEKRIVNVPASSVAQRQEEDRTGREGTECQANEQTNIDVYLSLDLMRRELSELRRMMQDSRAAEESLPDYSSQ
ncbi:hypothetical protein PM082_009709 [Marasmius tenuissimus]|nr:hypothetical protein PM082_009709 [Marasmius tenuissimus]